MSNTCILDPCLTVGHFIGMDPPPNTTLKRMQELATLNNIPIEYEMKKVKEGWLGKPKGMLQVLTSRRSSHSSNSERSNWAFRSFALPNTTLKSLGKVSSMPGAARRTSTVAYTCKHDGAPRSRPHRYQQRR